HHPDPGAGAGRRRRDPADPPGRRPAGREGRLHDLRARHRRTRGQSTGRPDHRDRLTPTTFRPTTTYLTTAFLTDAFLTDAFLTDESPPDHHLIPGSAVSQTVHHRPQGVRRDHCAHHLPHRPAPGRSRRHRAVLGPG